MDMSIHFPNLGLNFSYIGQSVKIFGFEITFYGILISLGMLVGLWFMILEAKRSHEDVNAYYGMAITSLLTGIIGARLFYVLFAWNLYKGETGQMLNVRAGGMAFYGALFGGMLGAAIYCGIRKLSFMQMADSASIGLLAAQMIGRWGDFFNRESFGGYTNNVLAMELPLSAIRSSAVTAEMRENIVSIGGVSFVQMHPVFLYESLWCLILLMLTIVWKRKKVFHGEVFLRYLTFYGLGRFFFEWIRTDKLLIPGTSFGISQVISAFLFVFCGIMVTIRHKMAKKRAALRKRRRERLYETEERTSYRTGTDPNPDAFERNPEYAADAGSEAEQQGGSAEESENQSET